MAGKNESQELRDMMFAQMKKLSDPNCNLEKEINRAKALAGIGHVIVNSHRNEVEFMKAIKAKSLRNPKMLGNGK